MNDFRKSYETYDECLNIIKLELTRYSFPDNFQIYDMKENKVIQFDEWDEETDEMMLDGEWKKLKDGD